MIVLFTDFGADDIYVAQVKAVLAQHAPGQLVLDLLHRAPSFDPRAGAHLLAALQSSFPAGAVFMAVVDPGVGGERDAVVLEADGKCYVGPDNGLLSVVAARAARVRTSRVVWRPPALTASFHGRDLFAPVAAWIAAGTLSAGATEETSGLAVRLGPDDLAEIVYVDHYGNLITGLRAASLRRNAAIVAGKHTLRYARVFTDAQAGSAFWYENSVGLVEIAVNAGSAAALLGIAVGEQLQVRP